MHKDDLVQVEIDDIGVNGEGIGKVDGYIAFVKDAVIGDVVEAKVMKAKKNYGYARLIRIVTPSPNRISPRCKIARQCGGCQLQEMAYDQQLAFKERKIRGNLERIGGFSPELLSLVMEPIVGMDNPFHYRNKAQFPFGTDKQGEPITGFYAGRTHDIIANTDCALGVPENEEILEVVLTFMKKHNIDSYDEKTRRGLLRHVLIRFGFTTKEIMVCFVINGRGIPHCAELVDELVKMEGMTSISYSVNDKNTNVIMGDTYDILWGKAFITDYIGHIKYRISPLSFFQVNPYQTEKLYDLALEYAALEGRETVWDLYCGIGTISLSLAQSAGQVHGVEIVPQAIEDARSNAKMNGIENVQFYVGRAEEILPEYNRKYELEHGGEGAYADVVVVDPPRKGCEESLLNTMVDMGPDRIVYVSCDSATLARDLRYLCDRGYELRRVRGVDQFPMTVHVESVCLLSHKKPDSHINVKVEFGDGKGKVPLDKIAERAEAYKPKERVTYKMIKEYIEAKYGFKVHTAYIAEVKRDLGLPMYDAPNAVDELKHPRKHPTPIQVDAIKDALKHFEVI